MFSLKKKKKKKKKKGMKNTKKSHAWLGFSKIGLQLIRQMDFAGNDTAVRKLVRAK